MILWIDGAYGVGKTVVAAKLLENLFNDNAEILQSDYYFIEMLNRIDEDEENNIISFLGGFFPQNNMWFLKKFRKLIEEKAKNSDQNIIVDMALTKNECKEDLFDHLKENGIKIVHVILTADENTIRSRINNDENRDKGFSLGCLVDNITFLEQHFSDAIRVKTDNRTVDDIVAEIVLRYNVEVKNL